MQKATRQIQLVKICAHEGQRTAWERGHDQEHSSVGPARIDLWPGEHDRHLQTTLPEDMKKLRLQIEPTFVSVVFDDAHLAATIGSFDRDPEGVHEVFRPTGHVVNNPAAAREGGQYEILLKPAELGRQVLRGTSVPVCQEHDRGFLATTMK